MKTAMTPHRFIIRSKRFRRPENTKEPKSHRNTALISTRYRPFRPLKWALSHPEKGHFATRGRPVRNAIIRKALAVRQMRKVLKTRVFAAE